MINQFDQNERHQFVGGWLHLVRFQSTDERKAWIGAETPTSLSMQTAFPCEKSRIEICVGFPYCTAGLIGIALFVAVGWAFYVSPVHYLMDGSYSLLMDEALIHEWTPDMMHFQVPRRHGASSVNDGYPWSIRIIKGRLLYVYPWGSPLLSLPAVALFNADGFKIAPHRTNYKYDWYHELRMQVLISTGLCALTVWLVFVAAGHYMPITWSVAVALAAAFGTAIWSTASRSLWPQTWAVLLIMIAVWILLSGPIRPFLLGTVLAWSCLARPTVIPEVAIITIYLLFSGKHRLLPHYIAGGLVSAVPICAMMHFYTGGLFSAYYSVGMLDFPHDFLERLYGVLFSPSRGLFIFSPVTLVALYLIVRYWKHCSSRGLAVLALTIIGLHLTIVSSWVEWWGGPSYGPRLQLELVPWFVLLAILGIRSFLEIDGLNRRRRLMTTSAAVLAVLLSIITNAPGALAHNALGWRSYDSGDIQALWDWHDPQFLCWLPQYRVEKIRNQLPTRNSALNR